MKKLITIVLAIATLMSAVPMAQAAEITVKNEDVIALQLEYSDFNWVFVNPDSDAMTYVGLYNLDSIRNQLEAELKNIGVVEFLGTGKTMSGNVVIRTKANTRFSYYLESDNVLNINGSRYKLSNKQAEHISNIVKLVAENEFCFILPKWFAWMNPSNVTSFTQFHPLIADKDFNSLLYSFEEGRLDSTVGPDFYDKPDEPSPFSAEVYFMSYELFESYFSIENGGRYELGSVQLPNDKEYYEMTINFKSGVYYKVMVHGTTLLLESSDMSYGCKYTLKSKHKNNYGSIREAYYHWTDFLAHPPTM